MSIEQRRESKSKWHTGEEKGKLKVPKAWSVGYKIKKCEGSIVKFQKCKYEALKAMELVLS